MDLSVYLVNDSAAVERMGLAIQAALQEVGIDARQGATPTSVNSDADDQVALSAINIGRQSEGYPPFPDVATMVAFHAWKRSSSHN